MSEAKISWVNGSNKSGFMLNAYDNCYIVYIHFLLIWNNKNYSFCFFQFCVYFEKKHTYSNNNMLNSNPSIHYCSLACTSVIFAIYGLFFALYSIYVIGLYKSGYYFRSVIYSILFMIIFALGIISFVKTVITGIISIITYIAIDPGRVSRKFSFEAQYRSSDENYSRGITQCSKCSTFRPPRAHHCHICDRCILTMDHHCPWTATCIGFYNKKFFIQFLCYSVFACFYIAVTCFISKKSFAALLGEPAFIGSFSVLIVIPWFTLFHLYLVVSNRTTLDCRNPPGYSVNRGWYGNWKMFMGPNIIDWISPFHDLKQSNDPYLFRELDKDDEEEITQSLLP